VDRAPAALVVPVPAVALVASAATVIVVLVLVAPVDSVGIVLASTVGIVRVGIAQVLVAIVRASPIVSVRVDSIELDRALIVLIVRVRTAPTVGIARVLEATVRASTVGRVPAEIVPLLIVTVPGLIVASVRALTVQIALTVDHVLAASNVRPLEPAGSIVVIARLTAVALAVLAAIDHSDRIVLVVPVDLIVAAPAARHLVIVRIVVIVPAASVRVAIVTVRSVELAPVALAARHLVIVRIVVIVPVDSVQVAIVLVVTVPTVAVSVLVAIVIVRSRVVARRSVIALIVVVLVVRPVRRSIVIVRVPVVSAAETDLPSIVTVHAKDPRVVSGPSVRHSTVSHALPVSATGNLVRQLRPATVDTALVRNVRADSVPMVALLRTTAVTVVIAVTAMVQAVAIAAIGLAVVGLTVTATPRSWVGRRARFPVSRPDPMLEP
jgi:hypothetical protein